MSNVFETKEKGKSMKEEIHDFIIWDRSKHGYDFLLNYLKEKFQILDVYEVKWTKENFERNLRRFYGPTLPNPQKKMMQCGTGSFLMIIFLDPKPVYKFRKTSLGMQKTNVNVYDAKRNLRKVIEGEYPIHGSIHEKESNHDITLILGKNPTDLLKQFNGKWNGKIKDFKGDLIGTGGWKNLFDIFYLLNSTTNYVILRNFEEFPKNIISDKHRDIDILVDDLIHLPYMLNQQNVIESKENCPFVNIENKNVKFDFRYVGDTYYDEKWSKDILEQRILFKNNVYVPNDKHCFYTLTYHCIIHGASLKNYQLRLSNLSKKLNILNFDLNESDSKIKLKKLLDNFMIENGYIYTDSLKYRIRHNEMIRLAKVSLFVLKHEGLKGLMRSIKRKIK